ncbi:hypothetical protein CRENBAI_024070 [Crenichthys baileyi]|uniref:Uncharacterized protein n=1 Tax=Crenichthys baileyi TaxID=28760 RepID=A0AAV9SDS7_9TELE
MRLPSSYLHFGPTTNTTLTDVLRGTSSTSAMSRSSFPETSTAPAVQEISPGAESPNTQHLGVIHFESNENAVPLLLR